MKKAVHFVGFRGDEYWRAVLVFGKPDFFHMAWDRRCLEELANDDLVVFAKGDETQEFKVTHNDSRFF